MPASFPADAAGMSGASEVDALFARLGDDQAFRATLLAADDDTRRELIRAAGFGPYRMEDVRTEVSAVLEAGRRPGLPESAAWAPPPELAWPDAPLPIMLARRSALVFGAVAAAGSTDRGAPWPPSPVTLSYVIAGAVKGGTTALDHFLSQHPDVCTAIQKETHFFVREVFFETTPPRYEWLHMSFSHYQGEKAVGEATPEYMYFSQALARMRDYNPRLKLILLLRHPADRAYSQYRMAVVRGLEERSFAAALRADARADAGTEGVYTAGGFYLAPIQDVLRHFPRRQVLLLRTEDLRQRHVETVARTLEFLGVDPEPVPPPRELLKGGGPPMAAAERRFLLDMYDAEVTALEDFLGWDLADWRR